MSTPRWRYRTKGQAAARLLAAAAMVLAALGAAGTAMADPGPSDATAGRPAVFAGIAAASAVFQTSDRNTGLSAVYQPVYGSLPDAFSVFGSDTLSARGAVYYPGATVVGLPSLICVAGGPCNLPHYPLAAYADSTHPSASINAPGPLGSGGSPALLSAGTADARASLAGASADGAVAGYGAAPLVHVNGLEAHTTQSFKDTSTLVSHAESRLSGIDILGGLIHIDAIFATSTSKNDGQSVHTQEDNVTVTGVRAQGQPAAIDANGITITGSGQGKVVLDALNNALRQTLSAAGVQIHLIGRTTARASLQRRCGSGEVDGVELFVPVNLTPVPLQGDVYHTEVVLGGACSAAAATADRGGQASTGPDVPPASPAVPGSGGPDASALASPFSASDANVGPTALPGGQRAARRPIVGHRGSASLESDLRGSLVTHRIELLYLSFTLAFLGICLGFRPFLPARFPAGP